MSAEPGRLAVGVSDAAKLISWTRNGIYQEIAAGRLRSFKLGRRRLIRIVDLMAFVERRALLESSPAAPQPRRSQSGQRGVLPFPEMGTGVETDHAASSAAARGRSTTKKTARLSR